MSNPVIRHSTFYDRFPIILLSIVLVTLACGDGLPIFSGGDSTASAVSVSPDRAQVEVGGTQQFTALVQNSAGDTLSDVDVFWSTGNTSVATVSDEGVATGRSGGPTPVIARVGAVADSGTIVVEPSPEGASTVASGLRSDRGSP